MCYTFIMGCNMQLLRVISVLIIDDSPTVRSFITSALETTGFRFVIEVANDGGEAINLIRANVYDIIFIDLNMPVASGVEVLAAAKASGRNTFAVAMSGALNGQNEALLKSFGAYDFLKKPFTDRDVHKLVETYFVIKLQHQMLLVDDSITVRGIVRKILSKSIFNLKITEAGNAEEAFKATRERTFRIIFSDLNMPGMNGIELARALKDQNRASSVVLMSTEISPALDAQARDAGAMAFLRKPFSNDDVDTILHHAFGLQYGKFSKAVKLFAGS